MQLQSIVMTLKMPASRMNLVNYYKVENCIINKGKEANPIFGSFKGESSICI